MNSNKPLITKIVPKYYQGIQEMIQFDVSTIGLSGESVQANLTFTLYDDQGSNLVARRDKVFISQNRITIYPGLLRAGNAFTLKVQSTRYIWEGEDNFIIEAKHSDIFSAQLLKTGQFNNGDSVEIKIRNHFAFTHALNCYIGTYSKDVFSVGQIVDQITNIDVTVDFKAPYLVKDTVVDYKVAVK